MYPQLPKIIGHRGCRAPGLRENTSTAVTCAIEQRADLVEFDVVSTVDGHFVALHLPSVRFLVTPPWQYRLEELPPVDTVAAILHAVASRVGIYLDIKQPMDESRFLDLAEMVDAHHNGEVVVGSFHRRVLLACAKHRPRWIVNYDCLPRSRAVEEARDMGAQWISPIPWGIRRSFVEHALTAGLRFVPAGNESDRRQLRFALWGAHALSTFRPARLRQLLQERLGLGIPGDAL